MRIAVVSVRPVTKETGGAERLVYGLVDALRVRGDDAEAVEVASDEATFETIQETYLRAYDLDVSAYDAVISTKVPGYLVRHARHVCWLVHTVRAFYDLFDESFPQATSERRAQRDLIRRIDTGALSPPRTKRVFCIGQEVAERLSTFNAIEGTVLHPGLRLPCRTGAFGDYVLAPGRLTRWKRSDLIVEAFKTTCKSLRLVICGTGEDEARLRALAGDDPRIEFRGWVDDAELVGLYAGALGVVFAPLREDFGYVALEAFASGKPVVTCSDSGEPARLVDAAGGGTVCDPTPTSMAAAIARLDDDRSAAKSAGGRAKEFASKVTWGRVADVLTEALR